MLQEKDLVEFYTAIRMKSDVDIHELSAAIQDSAKTNEIPATSSTESVKFGSLLKSHVDDCIRITHPDHTKDYFSIIIHKEKGELIIYRYGFSKQMDKKMEKQAVKKSGGTFVKGFFTGHQPEDGYGGMFVGAAKMMKGTAGMLFHAVKSAGGSKDKLKEEEAWYDTIYALISEACS